MTKSLFSRKRLLLVKPQHSTYCRVTNDRKHGGLTGVQTYPFQEIKFGMGICSRKNGWQVVSQEFSCVLVFTSNVKNLLSIPSTGINKWVEIFCVNNTRHRLFFMHIFTGKHFYIFCERKCFHTFSSVQCSH